MLSSIPDINILHFENYDYIKDLNTHLFSCTKRLIFRFNNDSKTWSYNPQIKNSKISFAQTTNISTLSQSNIIYPLNTYFDNLNYYSVFNNINEIKIQPFLNLANTLFRHNLRFSLVYYKIITLCTLVLLKIKKFRSIL